MSHYFWGTILILVMMPGTAKAQGVPICGQSNDGLAHIPPNWTNFTPPAEGSSYVDPVFGCTVTRLTAVGDEQTWDGKNMGFAHYYSSFLPMNATDTWLFILADDGSWRIKNLSGNPNPVVPKGNMPPMNNGHPVWDATDGCTFYYTYQNTLYKGHVGPVAFCPPPASPPPPYSVISSSLYTFSEYPYSALTGGGINSIDSADFSQDGDHIALVGQNQSGNMDVFVWSISSQIKGPTYTTSNTCVVGLYSVNETPQPGCLHKLQLAADNNLAIQFANDCSGTEQGLRLLTTSGFTNLQDTTNHMDTGYDLSGNSVFIAMNNSSTLPGLTNGCPSGSGIDVRVLPTLAIDNCLLDKQPSWHVSYRGNQSQPWVALSFFDTRTSGPEFYNNDSNFQAPTAGNWQLYEDELILGKIDGSAIYRLAHARSRSMENYWATPRAAISRDGKYVIFTSSMAYSNGCPSNMDVANQCNDVYLIQVH
jgi:hypothetical protein